MAEGLGAGIWIAEARTNVAEDLLAVGRTEEAAAQLARSIVDCGDLVFYLMPPLTMQARILLDTGDAPGARAAAREAAGRAPWMRVFAVDARRVEAEALAHLEGLEAAMPLLQEVEALAAQIQAAPVQWRAALALARLLAAAGRHDEARAAARRALAALESVARDLDPADRATFEASEPMVRARAALA